MVRAQDKTPAQVFQLTPPKLMGTDTWKIVGPQANQFFAPRTLKTVRGPIVLRGQVDTGLCSVPLLNAHADAVDPGIATKPKEGSVAIPKANVPAPACEK